MFVSISPGGIDYRRFESIDMTDNAHSLYCCQKTSGKCTYWLSRPYPVRSMILFGVGGFKELEIPYFLMKILIRSLNIFYFDIATAERDTDQIACGKRDIGNPLYIKTALEEIRTLGFYDEITERINNSRRSKVSFSMDTYRKIIPDTGFRDKNRHPIGTDLVRKFVSFIWVSRHGLSQSELTELIESGDPLGNIAALQRFLRPYLIHRGNLLDFTTNNFVMPSKTNIFPRS